MTQKAIWFGPKNPTENQIKEAKNELDFEIVEVERGKSLRNHAINSQLDAYYVVRNLIDLLLRNDAGAIFSDSWPAAIQQVIVLRSISYGKAPEDDLIKCYASWKIKRKHLRWCFVGYIARKPLP